MIRGLDPNRCHSEHRLVRQWPFLCHCSISHCPLHILRVAPIPKPAPCVHLGIGCHQCGWAAVTPGQSPGLHFSSKQLLPLTPKRSFCHTNTQFVQTSQYHGTGFGPGFWTSEENQKRMTLHYRGLANRLHSLRNALLKHWVQGQWWTMTVVAVMGHRQEPMRSCATLCPVATFEEYRSQIRDRNKADAANRWKHSTRITLQLKRALVGVSKLQMPIQRSCAVWSSQPSSALLQDGVIKPHAPHMTAPDTSTSGIQTHNWLFQVSDHCIFLMENLLMEISWLTKWGVQNCSATEKQQISKCQSVDWRIFIPWAS